MTEKIKEMSVLILANKITFYLSLSFLLALLFFTFLGRVEVALYFLYLMFISWGVNKVFAYYQGAEMRLTYAVKIAKNAPSVLRVMALILSSSVALYGAIELSKLAL